MPTKPLLHFFLEEVELTGLSAATVRTPSHLLATPGRFELEAFPLARLLPGMALRFEPAMVAAATAALAEASPAGEDESDSGDNFPGLELRAA